MSKIREDAAAAASGQVSTKTESAMEKYFASLIEKLMKAGFTINFRATENRIEYEKDHEGFFLNIFGNTASTEEIEKQKNSAKMKKTA